MNYAQKTCWGVEPYSQMKSVKSIRSLNKEQLETTFAEIGLELPQKYSF